MSKAKINKYLKVEKHKVYTKYKAVIKIHMDEYKEITSEYGEEVGIAEIENVLEIPGFFTLEFPDEGDSISFFLPFNIFLHETKNTDKTPSEIIIHYEPEDLVFYGNFKEEEVNIRMLRSIYENGVKYLGNKPERLITALWEQLMPTNIPIHHFEVLVSQLYGVYDKKRKEFVPLRLTDYKYSKKYIMNLKESAHNMNNILGFMYGYSKDSLRTLVSRKKEQRSSYIEDMISGNFEKIIKKT